MLSIPAPLLSQFADEEILLQIGSIARPGLLTREPSENGIRLITSADPGDDDALRAAADEFQILLGVLRAWRPTAGQRQDEISSRVGPGPVRDGHGNQFLAVTSALYYRRRRLRSSTTRQRLGQRWNIHRFSVAPSG